MKRHQTAREHGVARRASWPRQLLHMVAVSGGLAMTPASVSAEAGERAPAAAAAPSAPATASGAGPALAATCYDFSALAGSFVVGDVIPRPDATFSFHQFQWGNLVWFGGGVATAVASGHAAGTPPQELNLNNIMARLTPSTPAAGARYRYADLGGNVNFGVNGDFRNVDDLFALDGTVVGGCDISVTKVTIAGNQHRGVVEITPRPGVTIERFGVGGQEFYLDDVCHW